MLRHVEVAMGSRGQAWERVICADVRWRMRLLMTEGTGQYAITLPRLIGSRGRLSGRIGARRRGRAAARGER